MKKIILTAFTFFGLASVTMAQVPAYVPTNGLVGWWPFTGNANDLSGNNNNGTVNGAALIADRFSTASDAYTFDGSTNYISVTDNNSLDFTNNLSFSCWVKIPNYSPAPIGGERATLGKQRLNNGTGFHLVAVSQAYSSKYVFGMQNLSTSVVLVSQDSIPLNNWTHIVGTYNGSQMKLYKNGILKGTINTNISLINSTEPFYIGKELNSGGRFFNGQIDDVALWNRPLTECEVKKLYYAASFTTSMSNSTICAGQSHTITAGGVPNYNWSTGSNTATTVVSPTSFAVYTITSTYTIGCVDSKTIAVAVNQNPTISVTSGTICNGQSFTITPIGASIYTIQGGSAVKTPTTSTSYTVIGTSSLGCVSQAAATSSVTVNQNPILTVENLTICAGQSATLNASGAATYTWNTNSNTASIVVSPSNTSNYSVSGTSNSCTSTQTVQLLVSACTGINELKAEQQLSINPNPNSGEFVIIAETSMQIKISDHLGRHIKTIEVKPGKNAYQLNDLSIGVYLLSGEANGKIYKGKMVIN